MRYIFILFVLLSGWLAPNLALAQITSAVAVSSCGTPINSPVTGNPYPLEMDLTGKLCISGSGGGGAGSVVYGQNGTSAMSASNPFAVSGSVNDFGLDGTSTVRQLATTTKGALIPAQGTPTSTFTSLAANTSTTIAAADSNVLGEEIQCATGNVGIGLSGQTLTSAALTTATGGPDTVLPSGSTPPLYTVPFGTTSAITAYTATAQVCKVTRYDRP